MHKRRVAGILQYGNRLGYKKVIKLQEGGHVGVAEGYNWREDPYELMLLQQKAAKDNAKLRYAAKNRSKSSTGTNKPVKSILGEFDKIKGGLEGSRKAAQTAADGMIQGFYNKLEENGREWLYSDAASMDFYKIQTGISNLTETIKNEKIEFDKLRDGIPENSLSAKAISTSGHAFGFAKNEKGRSEPAVITMDKYYENPDAFTIGTLTDLIEWKASKDSSGNNKIASMFLGDNALGDVDLRDMYIKDRGEVQFKIDKGMVVATENQNSVNAGEEIGSVDQVLNNVKSVLSGKTAENPNMGSSELKLLNGVIKDVTDSVYSSEISSNTRLRSSLLSQAVQDPRVMSRLRTLPKEDRAAYMQDAIGALWLEKIISKNYPSKAGGSTNSDGSTKITAKVDQAGGGYASMFDSAHKEQFTQGAIVSINGDGDVSEVYEYDSSDDDNALRMASIKFPARAGVLTPEVVTSAEAKKGDKDENFASRNPTIKSNLDVSRTYALDGTPLKKLMPGGETAQDFLNDGALIEPGSTVDFVMLPVGSDGQPMHADTSWMNKVKLKSREAYIKAYKAITKQEPPFGAKDLVGSSTNEEKRDFYNSYKSWLDSGIDVAAAKEFYKQENAKDPNHKDTIAAKRAWLMAKEAEKIVNESTTRIKAKQAQYGGVTMKLFGIYTVNYDDTYKYDGLDEAIINSAKGSKFGSGGVKDITSSAGKDNITTLNNVDNAYFMEDIKSLKLIAPVRSMADRLAAKGNQNWTNRAEVEKIERELTSGVNAISALSNPKTKNILHLLY